MLHFGLLSSTDNIAHIFFKEWAFFEWPLPILCASEASQLFAQIF